MAVPLALLLLLAVTLLAQGALLLARREEETSRGVLRLLAREVAVRSALLRVVGSGDTLPTLPVGGTVALASPSVPGAPPVAVNVRRLAAELHLLTAAPSGGVGGAVGLVVWTLDPAARAAAGAGGGAPDPGKEDPCADVRPVLAAAPVVVVGLPPPGLGLLPADTVLARATLQVSARGSPSPAGTPWACDPDDPWNWGSPSGDRPACATYRPFVAAGGDLVVEGGEGQGVLAVRGDLELRGTRFEGLVMAGGRVLLRGDARIVGAIQAGDGVAVEPGARWVPDACRTYLALLAAPSLRWPRLLPRGAWIRPL